MSRMCRQHSKRGFIAKISRGPDVKIIVVVALACAFAERVLPRAADLWVQAPLEQRQRFQQLFF